MSGDIRTPNWELIDADPPDGAAIGHFWNAASGAFLGYHINLQAPLRR